MNLHDILLTIQYLGVFGLFIQSFLVITRSRNKLHVILFFCCVAALINNIGYLFELQAGSEESYISALQLSYAGRIWFGLSMLLFIAYLTGIGFPKTLTYIFSAIHMGTYISIFFIRYNKLYYLSMEYVNDGIFPKLKHQYGILYYSNVLLNIFYLIVGTVMLFKNLKEEDRAIAQKRIWILLIATWMQGGGYIVQVLHVFSITRDYDVTMLGYFAGTILMCIALFAYDLMGTREIAREFVIDRISEAIIAVDNEGRVEYFNEPALKLYPELAKKEEQSDVINAIKAAIENNDNIKLSDRIYTGKENPLIFEEKKYGKLYALADVTEYIRYMEELQKQKDIADKANEAKTKFLANMSHEIRTPINAVLGMDEMILRETNDEIILSYAREIMTSGETLLSLINGILENSEKFKSESKDKKSYKELFHAPDARILVIDDTEMNLTVIKHLLKKTEIRIDTAKSGREGIEQAKAHSYDILFIDHMMPELDGIETFKLIRKEWHNKKTPAVALTANAIAGAREMYLREGFTDYLAKPVDGETLERLIISLLPKEKVLRSHEDIQEEIVPEESNKTEVEKTEEIPDWLKAIPEIDITEGLNNCGDLDGYMSIVSTFHRSAKTKAEEIEAYYLTGDLENYTIMVHALKSSARIIGAKALSELAKELEFAGKEKNETFIKENTDRLLSMYRELDEKLSAIDEKDDSLPEISEEGIREAYQTMIEAANAMEFGMLDDVITLLKEYKLKPEDEKRVLKIEEAFTALDWDGIIEMAKEAMR